MPRILRPYQEECVQAVGTCLSSGYRRILYVLATGCGKTLIYSDIVRRVLGTAEGARVLVLAHRQELISQGYQSVQEHCGLDEWEVQIEMERYRAGAAARVVIGSVQTVMNPARLEGWQPHVIICDESHRASAKAQYADVFARFGVPDRCILIGCTATAKRTDRKSLYARRPDGSPVILKGKAGEVEATDADTAFDVLAYDYGLLPAVEDGWLVPIIGHSRPTVTNLNGIKTANGDFEVGKLSHTIDNNARTNVAINAWRDIAVDRPTLAFCATVEHAHHSAELWRQAGYSAAALDGETERGERQDAFRDFKAGRIQVICNVGIASEGTDLPTCSCIVSLRPTKSWLLKVQQVGRGTRPLDGLLDSLQTATPAERQAAIAASGKADCIVLDLVDQYDKPGELCTVPAILDLPAQLNLEGRSLTAAKKMLDQFEEVKDRVIGECPITFTELQIRLEQVDLMRHSGARTVNSWMATEAGYRYTRVAPGYQCDLIPEADSYRLVVRNGGQVLAEKLGKPAFGMKDYLDKAASRAREAIDQHRANIPAQSRGTLGRLTEKQIRCLAANGHTREEVDTWPYQKARAIIAKYMAAWNAR